jgi:hypothetical protein
MRLQEAGEESEQKPHEFSPILCHEPFSKAYTFYQFYIFFNLKIVSYSILHFYYILTRKINIRSNYILTVCKTIFIFLSPFFMDSIRLS